MTSDALPNLPPLGEVALVLAAHGNRGEDTSNDETLRHAAALAGEAAFGSVSAGFLKGEPLIEDAMRLAAEADAQQTLVYPLFMADGYFTQRLLPQRIEAAGIRSPWRLLRPFGFAAALPAFCERHALVAARDAGYMPEASRLLIVGHGSAKSSAASDAAYAFAERVRALSRFAVIDCGFIEETPFVGEALAKDRRPTVVAGYFAGEGLHAALDVPEAINDYGGPAVSIGALGSFPDTPALIREEVLRQLSVGQPE